MTATLRETLRRADRTVRDVARRSPTAWRYGLNLGPTLAYRTARAVPPEAARVLADLDRDGVAMTSLDALMGAEAGTDLRRATDRLRQDRAGVVDAARARLAAPDSGAQKPYVVGLRGGEPVDAESDLARFACHPALLDVVHGYYAMTVRLRYYDVWHTLVTDEPPSQSQLWHRDPEDRLILKVFVALEEVTPGSGPFWYAPGTHAKGPVRRLPDHAALDGATPRSTDDQMDAVVPRDRWFRGTGPPGTVVFADTRGFHKGGHALAHERVVFVCQYLSRAAGRGGLRTDLFSKKQ